MNTAVETHGHTESFIDAALIERELTAALSSGPARAREAVAKASIDPTDNAPRALLKPRMEMMGRSIGQGQGPRAHHVVPEKEKRQDAKIG